MKQHDCVGIDVSARTLTVAMDRLGEVRRAEFDNDPEGHRKLVRWLTKNGRRVRVCLDATGVYHLDAALALHRARGVEVMVVNPLAMRNFARALFQRSKTDLEDALVHLEFARRMAFEAWQPPAAEVLELRALARRIQVLIEMAQAERNRRHACRARVEPSRTIDASVEAHLQHLEHDIEQLESEALRVVERDPTLQRRLEQLCSVHGIARRSAIRILAELAPLASDMTARQWVAYAGLDPAQHQSGSSVHGRSHISRRGNRQLRTALYMPALVAIQGEPHVRAFYQRRLQGGLKPLQAVVAVMRKLLHAIHGMFASDQPFDGKRLYALGT